ncbi:GPP34 family phosphoprotein [Streptomyces sp. HC44]|uniref:GPP34 family phosphoprotein n=1 Tax=Streptomyces scabichelini TaxID=2711217 RepID=A0A6G4V1R3_9ACTN|nr:GPP34 family phosphoprotein [Streptomyces scabichelini]NGO07830.1 GPP34 family phosphoprotein [Streptomyces scabichelini]
MTTARDLSIAAAGSETDPAVEPGDLSLALAGAELIDLIASQAVSLDGDRLVPGAPPRTDDPLLLEAASLLILPAPHETVADWLWRRGRDLAARYRAALAAEGLVAPARPHRNPFRRTRPAADSPALRQASDRWAAREPVLAGLAAAAGITDLPSDTLAGLTDEQGAVLAGVHQAVTELAAVRQRRSIEAAAFDNIWRGE